MPSFTQVAARILTVSAVAASLLTGASAALAEPHDATEDVASRVLQRLLNAQAPRIEPYTSGQVGWDISWPQCPSTVPATTLHFAIIGITGGKAFNENACLKQQLEWAQTHIARAEVYTNVNGMPKGWTSSVCEPADVYCDAYQYGWESAAHAVRYAKTAGADTHVWWLDVEQENYWRPDDRFSNERVIAGAIEYLHATGHEVGLYSTPYQWGQIAGGYAPGLPSWTAGARNLDEAKTRCTAAFSVGGGPVRLVQYISNEFDTNYVC